ncbi:flagellar brake protein [Virgibacillus ndiopensis]|uniref:flagellar brake protein n=1 Tax=Virgibacillus ndiopensis TaxID=2004408 RepID=UPI000C0750C0|nr:flagellar brake domain-containing protein [Virgibacillus ndiopensis]
MKIGTLLMLEVTQTDKNDLQKYRCKVIEKNEHYLFIDYPVNEQTKKTSYLPKGTYIAVTYVGSDQSVYSFHTQIVAKVKFNIPALAISLPEKSKINRIQRRKYVRIDTSVDVTVHSPNDSFEPFVTVTSDISGGGLSIILPNKVNLAERDTLDLWVVLPMQSNEYHYVFAQTEIIRINVSDTSVNTASLKFVSITSQAQQHIVQYCFEKQREARKKELL